MTTRKATPAPAAAVPAYEPERFYGVDLTRVVPWKGDNLIPAHGLAIRGDVLNALDPTDIADARPL